MVGEKDKTAATAAQHVDYEAALSGVMALANLFSVCVETFNLVHPSFRWDKQEQVLIAALGIQQARLLIWGDVVGVTSPPPTVTDRAVPKHPSAAYPDLKEPTFFQARDPRLEESEIRQKVDAALSALVDRQAHSSREEMMEKYGLKPPKRFTSDHQPALDTNRLEAFRERYELLKEVAESYAHLNTGRNTSIISTTWMISDFAKFAGFIKLTQDKIDYLIDLMDVRERVDRGVRMDIRALGWHLSADRARVALDTSKLKLIQEACKEEYPAYVDATREALQNIDREHRENAADYNPYTSAQFAPLLTPAPSTFTGNPAPVPRAGRGSISVAATGDTNGAGTNGAAAASHTPKDQKRGSIFGSLFKRKSTNHVDKVVIAGRSQSVASPAAGAQQRPSEPQRSLSDTGQAPVSGEPLSHPEDEELVGNVRSKSVGDVLDAPINTPGEEEARNKLEQLQTNVTQSTVADDDAPSARSPQTGDLMSAISVHDQYHGIARQETKAQW